MKKRVLSALMVLCMVLTLLPVSAFAAPNEAKLTVSNAPVTDTADLSGVMWQPEYSPGDFDLAEGTQSSGYSYTEDRTIYVEFDLTGTEAKWSDSSTMNSKLVPLYEDSDQPQSIPAVIPPEGYELVYWETSKGTLGANAQLTFGEMESIVTFDEKGEATITYTPVFEEIAVEEPDPAEQIIHVSYLIDGGKAIGTEDLNADGALSNMPTEYDGKEIEGWRFNNPAADPYTGEYTFNALAELIDSWSDDGEAWLSFYAIFAEESANRTIYVEFDLTGTEAKWSDGSTMNSKPVPLYENSDQPQGIPAVTPPEGYELVYWETSKGTLGANAQLTFGEMESIVTFDEKGEATITYTPVFEKVTKELTVNYVDEATNKTVGIQVLTLEADTTIISTNLFTEVPEGYVLAETGDVFIGANDSIDVKVRMVSTTNIIGINYWDVENNKQAGEGKVTVDAGATKVNSSQLTDIPEGYELVWTGDFDINDGWIYVEVRPVATTQTVGVNYWDIVNNEQAGEGEVTVAADATNVNSSALTDIPKGYELVNVGDFTINDGWIYVEVRPVATTQTVGVNYWDIVNNEQAGEGEVTVAADATNVNTSTFKDIPAGYELVWEGDLQINDGWVWVEVRPVEAETKTVGLNYWDVINNQQVAEGSVTVAADATMVNTSTFKDIPEGYELVWEGDLQINDGWVWVEVRPVEAETKTVGLNYWDVINNQQVAEGSVTVAADATMVNTSTFKDIPEGYELVWEGDLQINDGWVWVEVRPVEAETKTVGLNYWDVVNNQQVAEGSVTVAADATMVNTSTFKDIPAGYELVWEGDLQINDGWVWVEVRPVEAETKTVGLNYWDVVNNQQVAEGSVTVAADATMVNTSTFKDIPAGYELVWEGDLQINDGWVWVEVRPVEAPPVEKTFTVTFDSNGGSAVASQTVKEGEKAAKPANPTRDGYTFEGWFADEALKTAYDFNTPVTSDITLYADWDRRSSGGGGGGGSSSTKKYIITVTCGEGGEITPDGGSDNEVEVRKGNDQTFRISADNGYRISDVLVDGESVGNVDKYTFEDVDEDHEIEAIFTRRAADPSDSGTDRYLNTKDHVQYMTGYPDGSFGPGQNMTRAEAAQMFYALLLDQNVPHTVSFSDVPADAWYAEAVNTLASLGMINGYPDGAFRPDAPITRAEFCVIALAFAYEPEDFDCDFRDVSTSDWFYDYVAQATSYGWISGADRSFRPNECITRAEVSVIVNNMLGRVADEDYIDRHEDELNTFPDVKPSHWAYYSIMETANSHDYTKNNGNENWR